MNIYFILKLDGQLLYRISYHTLKASKVNVETEIQMPSVSDSLIQK